MAPAAAPHDGAKPVRRAPRTGRQLAPSSAASSDSGVTTRSGSSDVGQVARVHARAPHLLDERCVARPEAHVVPDARKMDRERRAPAARAQNRDVESITTGSASDARCRSRSRRRLARCRKRISAAVPAAAPTTGSRRTGEPGRRRQRDRRRNRTQRDVARGPHRRPGTARRDRGRERRQHREHACRDRDAFAAVEAQPDRIDVADNGRGAGQRRDAAAAARHVGRAPPRPRPWRHRAPSPTTPRQVPVVRITFAAPTLPLPATRTSIPARRASRNANGTEPAR